MSEAKDKYIKILEADRDYFATVLMACKTNFGEVHDLCHYCGCRLGDGEWNADRHYDDCPTHRAHKIAGDPVEY